MLPFVFMPASRRFLRSIANNFVCTCGCFASDSQALTIAVQFILYFSLPLRALALPFQLWRDGIKETPFDVVLTFKSRTLKHVLQL